MAAEATKPDNKEPNLLSPQEVKPLRPRKSRSKTSRKPSRSGSRTSAKRKKSGTQLKRKLSGVGSFFRRKLSKAFSRTKSKGAVTKSRSSVRSNTKKKKKSGSFWKRRGSRSRTPVKRKKSNISKRGGSRNSRTSVRSRQSKTRTGSKKSRTSVRSRKSNTSMKTRTSRTSRKRRKSRTSVRSRKSGTSVRRRKSRTPRGSRHGSKQKIKKTTSEVEQAQRNIPKTDKRQTDPELVKMSRTKLTDKRKENVSETALGPERRESKTKTKQETLEEKNLDENPEPQTPEVARKSSKTRLTNKESVTRPKRKTGHGQYTRKKRPGEIRSKQSPIPSPFKVISLTSVLSIKSGTLLKENLSKESVAEHEYVTKVTELGTLPSKTSSFLRKPFDILPPVPPVKDQIGQGQLKELMANRKKKADESVKRTPEMVTAARPRTPQMMAAAGPLMPGMMTVPKPKVLERKCICQLPPPKRIIHTCGYSPPLPVMPITYAGPLCTDSYPGPGAVQPQQCPCVQSTFCPASCIAPLPVVAGLAAPLPAVTDSNLHTTPNTMPCSSPVIQRVPNPIRTGFPCAALPPCTCRRKNPSTILAAAPFPQAPTPPTVIAPIQTLVARPYRNAVERLWPNALVEDQVTSVQQCPPTCLCKVPRPQTLVEGQFAAKQQHSPACHFHLHRPQTLVEGQFAQEPTYHYHAPRPHTLGEGQFVSVQPHLSACTCQVPKQMHAQPTYVPVVGPCRCGCGAMVIEQQRTIINAGSW